MVQPKPPVQRQAAATDGSDGKLKPKRVNMMTPYQLECIQRCAAATQPPPRSRRQADASHRRQTRQQQKLAAAEAKKLRAQDGAWAVVATLVPVHRRALAAHAD